MSLVLITVGLIAEQLAQHGSLHFFGVVDVVVGISLILLATISFLAKLVADA